MKIPIMILFLLISLFSKGQNKAGFQAMVNALLTKKVDTINAKSPQKLQSEEEIVILDARQKVEFDVSHLRNAKYVGYDNFDLKSVNELPKDKTIVIYCSVGKRSEEVGIQLQNAGFKNVLNLYGGIFD